MVAYINSNVFRDVKSGRLFSIHIVEHTDSPYIDKVQFAVAADASFTVNDTSPTTNVGMICGPDAFTGNSPSLLNSRTKHHCILDASFNAVSDGLCQTLEFYLYVTPAF